MTPCSANLSRHANGAGGGNQLIIGVNFHDNGRGRGTLRLELMLPPEDDSTDNQQDNNQSIQDVSRQITV